MLNCFVTTWCIFFISAKETSKRLSRSIYFRDITCLKINVSLYIIKAYLKGMTKGQAYVIVYTLGLGQPFSTSDMRATEEASDYLLDRQNNIGNISNFLIKVSNYSKK